MPRESVTGMTQAERRASTQTRLLDAAIDTVAEVGYVRASTTEIAKRAGVSRGAQLHHFPTKAELVGAAIDHSQTRRMGEYEGLVAQVEPGRARVEAAIDALWALFQSKDCVAWVEVAVASRADAELRPLALAAGEKHRIGVEAMFARLFPPVPGSESSPMYLAACKFLTALFDGLMVHRMMGYDDGPGRADEIVAVTKVLANLAFPTV